jgi:spore germination protein YaaH
LIGKCKLAWWFTENFCGDIYDRSLSTIQAHHDLIDEILPCTFVSDASGRLQVRMSEERLSRLFSVCNDSGVTMIPVVAMRSVEDLKTMLKSSTLRTDNVKSLVDAVVSGGFTGIDVDYECMPPEFREPYTEFFVELSAAMRSAGKLLSVPVHPKASDLDTTVPGGLAQDYPTLAGLVDNVRVMCYDQHHPGYAGPGPVGGHSWAERVMAYSATVIPADKLYMGLPTYGHEWDLKDNSRSRYVSFSDVEEIDSAYHPNIKRDEEGSPNFTYTASGSDKEIWYTDTDTFMKGMETAEKHGAAGVSVWVMGVEDPTLWTALAEEAEKRK